MHSVKRFLAFWYRLMPWIIRFPAKSFGKRVKILFDYIHLYRKKGLTRDERITTFRMARNEFCK